MNEFYEDIKQEFAVDSNPQAMIVFDSLIELLGDDLDGVHSSMLDAEEQGLLTNYDEDEEV